MRVGEVDVRNRQAEQISAHGVVEHPCWDFKKSTRRRTRGATYTKAREPRSRGRTVVVLYNRNGPHFSLCNITPSEFALKIVLEKQAA